MEQRAKEAEEELRGKFKAEQQRHEDEIEYLYRTLPDKAAAALENQDRIEAEQRQNARVLADAKVHTTYGSLPLCVNSLSYSLLLILIDAQELRGRLSRLEAKLRRQEDHKRGIYADESDANAGDADHRHGDLAHVEPQHLHHVDRVLTPAPPRAAAAPAAVVAAAPAVDAAPAAAAPAAAGAAPAAAAAAPASAAEARPMDVPRPRSPVLPPPAAPTPAPAPEVTATAPAPAAASPARTAAAAAAESAPANPKMLNGHHAGADSASPVDWDRRATSIRQMNHASKESRPAHAVVAEGEMDEEERRAMRAWKRSGRSGFG